MDLVGARGLRDHRPMVRRLSSAPGLSPIVRPVLFSGLDERQQKPSNSLNTSYVNLSAFIRYLCASRTSLARCTSGWINTRADVLSEWGRRLPTVLGNRSEYG